MYAWQGFDLHWMDASADAIVLSGAVPVCQCSVTGMWYVVSACDVLSKLQ